MPNLTRFLILASVIAMLAACGGDSGTPVVREPPPEVEPEPFAEPDGFGFNAVGHTSFTPVDETRNDRSLLVDVWYPVDAGDAWPVPRVRYDLGVLPTTGSAEVAVSFLPISEREGRALLVFSHDFGALNTQSTLLMEVLASHGFIMASVTHTGSTATATTEPSDDATTAATHRVPDISFVIDAMLEQSATAMTAFTGTVDGSRVGVLGQAFGGMTSLGVAAGWAGGAIDERVKAIVPISATVEGTFSNGQLADIELPALLLGGSEDTVVPISNNAVAFEQMTSSPALYKVDIDGATHEHFGMVCAMGDALYDANLGLSLWRAMGMDDLVDPYDENCRGPEADEVLRLENLYVVAFFRRHLRDEEAYSKYLTAEYAAANEPAINLDAK
jgi:predicted dienelactone hydrolase